MKISIIFFVISIVFVVLVSTLFDSNEKLPKEDSIEFTRYLELEHKGDVVLNATLHFPELDDKFSPKAFENVEKYYHNLINEQTSAVEEGYYELAVETYNDFKSRGILDEFIPFSIKWRYSIQLDDGEFISVLRYKDEFTGGSVNTQFIETDNFNVATGEKIGLNEFISQYFGVEEKDYSEFFIDEIRKQISETTDIDYFPDVDNLVSDRFSEEYVYFTDENIVIYYDIYALTPYFFGIQHFQIPFELFKNYLNI